MKCRCGETTVCLDSRQTTRRDAVRRRRECVECGRRFTTYELRSDDLDCLPEPDGRGIRRDRNEAIRELMEDGVPVSRIAEVFGLSTQYIYAIAGRDPDTPEGGEGSE